MSNYGNITDEQLRLKVIELEDEGKSPQWIRGYIIGWNKKPTGTLKKEAKKKRAKKKPLLVKL